MRMDKISIPLFSRKNLVYSIPVLASLIIGEIIIFALGGEHESVDAVTIMLLPLVAFSEEYVFRGYFQNVIQKNNKWSVSLISARDFEMKFPYQREKSSLFGEIHRAHAMLFLMM